MFLEKFHETEYGRFDTSCFSLSGAQGRWQFSRFRQSFKYGLYAPPFVALAMLSIFRLPQPTSMQNRKWVFWHFLFLPPYNPLIRGSSISCKLFLVTLWAGVALRPKGPQSIKPEHYYLSLIEIGRASCRERV